MLRPRYLKKPRPFLPIACNSTSVPSPSSLAIRFRDSLRTFVLNAPAKPRLPVSTSTAARFALPDGWRSSGNFSANSGEYRLEITSDNALAYGRAAMTRSCARFILDVATISIVRVILRVFSTDLIRPFSSRPLAIEGLGTRCSVLGHYAAGCAVLTLDLYVSMP